jgi:primosomal protein N' (replication factor Y)
MSNYYQVAVDYPLIKSELTYTSEQEHVIGSMVEVPLGRRKASGIVVAHLASAPADFDLAKIKPITNVIEPALPLSAAELQLYQWLAKYYHYSLGKLIFDCLPKFLKRPRKIEFIMGEAKIFPHKLSTDQQNIVDQLSKKLSSGFHKFFLHGVTGSGKSLVYLSLMQQVLAQGKSVQFLLPEINLTPQFVEIFKNYLNCKILSYHSGVSASEKFVIWKTLKEEVGPFLIMGVRSSVFLPIENLGLIIVDEEHDSSFKQNDRCPYNGRDTAIKKAQIHGCPVVLGSATPTVENFYYRSQAPENYFQLPRRVGEGNFPKIEIIDARVQAEEGNPHWPLMPESIKAIQESLAKEEQVLVFINKLGFAHYLQCNNCGFQFKNKECGCDNNLRFFKKRSMLSCAFCDFKKPAPNVCPECGNLNLMQKGFGTEKVEEVLSQIFPTHVIDRFDREEITTFTQLGEKLAKFHNKEIDVLVGTQMLSKGHNFERVNTVLILGIDQQMNYADFRSNERAYQLVTQVAGRAGRYDKNSKVLIQTMNPEHSLFKIIAQNELNLFYEQELPLREICACPPFARLANITISSRFQDRVIQESLKIAEVLRSLSLKQFSSVKTLGPTPCAVEKKANQYSWSILLKTDSANDLHNLLATMENNLTMTTGVSLKVDIDPYQVI